MAQTLTKAQAELVADVLGRLDGLTGNGDELFLTVTLHDPAMPTYLDLVGQFVEDEGAWLFEVNS